MLSPQGREARRARRAVYRVHHPDLGGDSDELIHRILELEAGAGLPLDSNHDVVFIRRRRLDRLRAWVARRHRPTRVV